MKRMSCLGNVYGAGWDNYSEKAHKVSIKSQFLDMVVTICP